ncbi:hypothetical protein [Vulcanisaeta souniana]|nr:hypothetical protein [Vulcanisaeta souniana]
MKRRGFNDAKAIADELHGAGFNALIGRYGSYSRAYLNEDEIAKDL